MSLTVVRKTRAHVGENWWTIEYVRGLHKKYWAYCLWPKRVIRIRDDAAGLDRLDVLIHELTHSRFPDLSEDAVTDFASTVAAILHHDGFRREEDEED
jgi:hypothetical protein